MTNFEAQIRVSQASEVYGLWGRAFRPFFLLMAVFGVVAIIVWVSMWSGRLALPTWGRVSWWHGHELIFGFAVAAVAGFILTASAVWSGRRAVQGLPLMALVFVWLLGRVAFLLSAYVPSWLVACCDLVFLPLLAGCSIWTLYGSGQWRNYALVAVLIALTMCNLMMHLAVLGIEVTPLFGLIQLQLSGEAALRAAIDIVILLLSIIGGRIIPPFTANALNRDGVEHAIKRFVWLDRSIIGVFVLLTLARILSVQTGMLVLSIAAAALTVGRMWTWQTWRTLHYPLLWSLHVGTFWIVVGLMLDAAWLAGLSIPASTGVHALTIGAVSGSILAVVTRVGLGHTGRLLSLPVGAVWIYVAINLAALVRVILVITPANYYSEMLWLSAVCWSFAMLLFVNRYFSILVNSRPDGRPG
jgi:uncharacterized protein involved in response to NO